MNSRELWAAEHCSALDGSRLASDFAELGTSQCAEWVWPAASFWQTPKVSSSKMLQDPKVAGYHLS